MCGIAGTINFNSNTTSSLKKALFHRGPDENGSYRYNNLELVHTRLSIQDIKDGHQPYEYEKYVIIFNGEIYNHLSLREAYLKDFYFQTKSDTETLLFMYIKFGKQMYDYLDGMYAFCILDKTKNCCILSRDRAGKKPFYLYKKNDQILFASELNAIKSVISDLQVNEDHINFFLQAGYFFKNDTVYADINQIGAGTHNELDIDNLQLKSEKYFDITTLYNNKNKRSLNDELKEVDNILEKSVKDRLLSSDIEVGAFLSGGIDSSLVVAKASEYVNRLKTFTVKFDGAYDESHLARLTAERYGTEHYELDIRMNVKNDVEKILLNYGHPFFDSSAIPSYYVSKEAKKHVSVVLNGDGADELFGGYRRYVPLVGNLDYIANFLSPLISILPKPHNKKSYYNYFYRLLAMSSKNGISKYLSATTNIFEDIYNLKLESMRIKDFENIINSRAEMSSLDQTMFLDFDFLLYNNLLVKMDIATMAHSLEARSPFLSKYFLEYAPSLESKFKINGTTTKYLLRELSKKYLPSELHAQPKRGFEIPLKKWIEDDLKENIYDHLQANCYSENFIDRSFIDSLLENKANISRERRARILWLLFTLEVWYKNEK